MYSEADRDKQTLGIEVRRSAKLVDSFRHFAHVPLLFLGMLFEFFLHAIARNARRGDGVHRVAQYAHDLSSEHRLQDVDGLLDVPLVSGRHCTLVEIGARALAQLLNVSKEGLIVCGLHLDFSDRILE